MITRNLRILNGCRFAAKYFDLYTMKIFRPSEPFSDSSSLSSTCMPTWGLKRYFRFCPGFVSIHGPQFQEYSRKGISFKYTDEDIKIIVASNYITGAARRPAVSYNTVMRIIVFCTRCYNSSQCTNHGCKLLQTTFQMCLILWTHGHSNTVVVFDSNDLS